MIKERDAEIENYEEILKGSIADQASGWVGVWWPRMVLDVLVLVVLFSFVCVLVMCFFKQMEGSWWNSVGSPVQVVPVPVREAGNQ